MSVKKNLFSGRAGECLRTSKIHMRTTDATEIARAHGRYVAQYQRLSAERTQGFVSQGVDESLGIYEMRFEIAHAASV
ncbi:MAG TPA: hypothetical protein VGC38_05035 [Pseudolabrys sp.]